MFVAKDEIGQLWNLLENTSCKRQVYYCPACHGEVILKAGSIKIPHFAHRRKTDCDFYSENESLTHLKGKQLLYEWSQKQARLEVGLPAIKQRPDLLLDKIAIEFQCSPLSIQRLQERIKGYQEIALPQWWILGGDLQKRGRLTALIKHFCSFNPRLGFYFWSLDCETRSLLLHYHVQELPKSKQRWQTRVFTGEQELQKIFQYQQSIQLFHTWQTPYTNCLSYQKEVQGKLFRKDPTILKVQEALYCRGSHLLKLPSCCYAPSEFQLIFKDWLLYFRFYLMEQLERGQSFQLLLPLLLSESRRYCGIDQYPLLPEKKILRAFIAETCSLLAEPSHSQAGEKNSSSKSFQHKLPLKI